MRLGLFANIGILMLMTLASLAEAKTSKEWFEQGYARYMAANCAEAMDPLYQATLKESDVKDTAHLYLAHCQSIFGRGADAAYNLDKIKSKNLKKADRKLYKELSEKHRAEIDVMHKLYFSLTPYVGSGSSTPSTVKGSSSFYGLSLGVSRPVWSVGAFYESYAMDMKPAAYKDYTQTMIGGQVGFFIVPVWRLGGSYTQINGSNDQLKSVSVSGVQTDFYVTPLVSLFAEYYMSNYPTLLYNAAGAFKYPVSANEFVVGVGFPIINTATYGFNGSASYSGISLTKSSDKSALENKNLKETARYELALSAYVGKVNGGLTYWGGEEVLGVRSRGAVVYNSTDLHKGGSKVSLGYTINNYVGLSAAYGLETYYSTDVNGTYRNFESATTTGSLLLNW